MQFSVYQESYIGGRSMNQDRMGYSYTRDALLLVLADGMGGHLRGEIAAQITMKVMSDRFQSGAQPYIKKPERFLEDAFIAAHAEIHRYKVMHSMADSPRTTIVACLVQHNTAIWAHCGDSRLYWVRRGQLLGRTRDHSHIEHLIATGAVDPKERATHPDRNKLYNCLGASSPPKVDISRPVSLQPGDVLMLCSDGLWSQLPDEEIVHRLSTETVVRAVPDLLGMATAIAGPRSDNATALAIMWQGSADGESTEGHDDSMISTRMLEETQVNTTISAEEATEGPHEVDAFSEDEIEKAIAEIRDAIEKSSQILKP